MHSENSYNQEVTALLQAQGNPGEFSPDCIIEIIHKPLGEKGEDAFAYSFEKKTVHTQAVFDGCGGAGSWQYTEFKNSTGAFIAAQSMAKNYMEWFNAAPAEVLNDAGKAGESFHTMAQNVLSDLKKSCAPMKVSGSMVKAFPCTASVALMAPDADELSLITMNIGDSRVYFLTPQMGLVQLTIDDSEGSPDPLESLRDSPPLSDMLNADKPFTMKTKQLSLTYPCAIICATDGVFGYLRSPMDFEYVLLNTLMHSGSFSQFEDAMKEEIKRVTGDDSICIMSFYGWGSFENVRKSLAKRLESLSALIRSLDAAMGTDSFDSVQEEIWKKYKKETVFDEMQG